MIGTSARPDLDARPFIGRPAMLAIGASVTVFVWCLAMEQILAGISASAARFLPLLGAITMAGADSRAGMPPLPDGIHPLPFAAMTGILAALLVIGSGITAHRLDRDIT